MHEIIDQGWRSLLELDREAGLTKGSAFRAFRRIEADWQEPRDYRVLHHQTDRPMIDELRDSGRIYPSTVNLVLLCPALSTAVLAQMRRMTTDPAE